MAWNGVLRLTILTLAAIWLSAAANAAEFGRSQVVGVAANDTLNIRKGVQGASSLSETEIIGQIPFNSTNVFATGRSTDFRGTPWLEVHYAGVTGWVSSKFIRNIRSSADGFFPQALVCSGTEPFWSAQMTQGGVALSNFDGNFEFDVDAQKIPVNNRIRQVWHMRNAVTNQPHIAVVSALTTCSDGMSDVDYPFEIIWTPTSPTGHPLSGCCGAFQ